MKDASQVVRVEGLDEFRARLKELGAEWPKALGQANKQAAGVIVKSAQERADALGSTAAHVSSSIKAAAQERAAVITLGGNSMPMALGAEFGARKYPQFPPWRGNQWTEGDGPAAGVGYFLNPAVRETRDEFVDVYDAAMRLLTARAFPD